MLTIEIQGVCEPANSIRQEELSKGFASALGGPDRLTPSLFKRLSGKRSLA